MEHEQPIKNTHEMRGAMPRSSLIHHNNARMQCDMLVGYIHPHCVKYTVTK